MLSDGLSCFAGVIDAGCAHSFIVVGQRKPREMEILKWVNTMLCNLKTAINGAPQGHSVRQARISLSGRLQLPFQTSV
ncbi:hypothetical protein GCM10009107_13680 [Ideonella azotifigens]|uniref:Uncharacterized protein n=1 Tax=Ideonella azotifigens TaxID=513160 RepID=A0ABN1JTG1_9BURK